MRGRDFHHLCRVLRLTEDDSIDAVDPDGAAWHLRLVRVGPSSCTAEAAAVRPAAAPSVAAPALVLLQCLPKGRKMDLIIRQAVEAGVEWIVPLVSDHAIVRPDEMNARLDEAVERERGGTAVFFHEDPAGGSPLYEILAGAEGSFVVLIGPEGGLSPREVALLQASGFRRVWLGDGVLRTETAALYALAAVRTIVRERETWRPTREG
ncbi:MAG: RsmE family RNA methyltransferase [Spirochaetes bacterium]|nr:RsmE family RNA methyltransferase [Spirochaetota bacterium]